MMYPYKTILVCKHNGKEVGRIRATSPNAEQYQIELVRQYGSIEVDYEPDPTDGLFASLTPASGSSV